MAANGDYFTNGGAVWKTYTLDFRLPFNEIDTLKLVVGFKNGTAASERDSEFTLPISRLPPIPPPAEAKGTVPFLLTQKSGQSPKGPLRSLKLLLASGGRWFYQPEEGITRPPATLVVNAKNAARLYYIDGQLSNPFAKNMTAWLRKGYLDLKGQPVDRGPVRARQCGAGVQRRQVDGRPRPQPAQPPDRQVPRTPDRRRQSHSIQEMDHTYYLPLEPVAIRRPWRWTRPTPTAPCQWAAIGIAINGVMFYNPFDAGGMEDGHDIMDRCCGHPSPDNRVPLPQVSRVHEIALLGRRARPFALHRFRVRRLSDLRPLRGEGADGQGR